MPGGGLASGLPRGVPFIVAGVAATVGAGFVDQALYEMTSDADDLRLTFMYASAKRSLAVAGGVLIAVGAALELAKLGR
jgi:hypothetical protein